MKKNVASQKIGAQMVSATDGSAFTSSVTVYVTIDAGTQAIGSVGSGACTHEGNGYHTYAPAQAETNGDLVAFTFIGTGAVPGTVQVFTSFPQTGDSFALIGATGSGLTTLATAANLATVAGYLDTEIADIQARLPAALTAGGNMKSDALAISGDTVAADNAEAFFDGTGYAGTNNVIPTVTTLTNLPAITANWLTAAGTAADFGAEMADAIWNAATASYGSAGSYGEALEAVGSAADPWLTNLPGAYGAGTAGKIIGDNINATISSRATQTSVDTIDDLLDTEVAAIKSDTAAILIDTAEIGVAGVGLTALATQASVNTIDDFLDTEVAAIKAKTDLIPAAPAAVGDIPTAVQNADALLNRDMSAVSDSTARSPLMALRFLRNKWSVSGTDLTVKKEDDTTTAWTAVITAAPGADPISGSDPA